MKFRYRNEEEMKDSGVLWGGNIPQKWNIVKLATVISELTDYVANGSFESLAKNVKYLSEEDYAILIRTQDNSNGFKGPFVYIDEKAYNFLLKSKVYPDDIIISNVGAVGNVFKAPALSKPMSLAPNSILLRTTQNNQFMYYLLQSEFAQEEIKIIVSSTAQPKFNKTNFRAIKTILPTIDEQEKIAKFLDEKTDQFDSIISKKESLIEKLEEAKKSLISEVVTGKVKVIKTFDGYELVERKKEEMKDSEVNWLENVPTCWDVKKIKYLFEIKKNIAGKIGYDILSVTQLGIKIKDITKNEGQLSMDYSKYQLVDVNDFVMNHMDLLTGFVDCSMFNGVTSPDYRVFRLINNKNCNSYYNYIFQLCYHNKIFYGLAQGVSGMGRWRLQTDKFLNFKVPLPSINEQKNIAECLSKYLSDMEDLKYKLKINIKMLKEAKQSLISEAVTGKIEILE